MALDHAAAAIAKDRAERLFAKGRYREALEAYERIESCGEKDPRVYLRIGDIERKLEDTVSAIAYYRKASESFIRLGFIVKAVAVCKMIINLNPSEEDAQRRLAELHAMNTGAPGACGAGPAARLPRTPLFSDLTEKEFLEAVRKVRSREIPAGDYLFHEGDRGDSIYILAEGAVEVEGRAKDGVKAKVAVLKDGDIFGEFGFFLNSRRTTDVRAVKRSTVLELTKGDLDEMIKKHKRVEAVLFDFYKERVVDRLMALSEVFRCMSAEDRKRVLCGVTTRRFQEGSVVVNEGEAGDTMYLIKSGRVSVTVKGAGRAGRRLTGLEEGDFFGEIALATNRPRLATVKALSDLELVAFSRPVIKDILSGYPEMKASLEKVIKNRLVDIIKAREEGAGVFI